MLRGIEKLWTRPCNQETPTVEVICLANSRKNSGRCVAGLRMDGGGWIRPVSTEPEGVLRAWHYTLANGQEAAVLDVLKMRLIRSQPAPHHPENWLMDVGQWEAVTKCGSLEVRDILLRSAIDGPELLGGSQNRIGYEELERVPATESLALVRPQDLHWRVEEGHWAGRRRVRAEFTLAGTVYSLPLTDPIWIERLSDLHCGYHPSWVGGQEVLLTVSLSEPFAEDGFCYKLAVAVIVVPLAPKQKSASTAVLWWRYIWTGRWNDL